MSAKLGEILVRENLITAQQLREALEYQRQNGGRLGSNLVQLGFISAGAIVAVVIHVAWCSLSETKRASR